MSKESLTDVLERLLVAAEQSHLAYEETHPGTDWQPYYAENLYRALGDQYTLDQVSVALRAASAAHGVHEETELHGVRDEQWPRWYAAHMAKQLSREWFSQVIRIEEGED